jgi:phosphohistidine phosphatase
VGRELSDDDAIVRRRLHLLRHAKSSWDDLLLADDERPLAPRGRRAAIAMAGHLGRARVRPCLVACSTARRARETLDLVHQALGRVDVEFEPALYHASLERLRRFVGSLPDAVDEVLIVGHNPGLQDLVLDLADPSALRARVEEKLPTCALATLEARAARWDELAGGGAALVSLVLPRELEEPVA